MRAKKTLKTFSSGYFNEPPMPEGKKLRAKLFLSFYDKPDKDAFKIASAIELLHMATLIHDDILDSAVLRRGESPLYQRWGVSASVLYGDYLFAKGFGLISELEGPELCKEAARAVSDTLTGEIEEHYNRGNPFLSERKYLSIIRNKSGSLFGIAAKFGAMITGCGGDTCAKAYDMGAGIGTAYQILDDCRDYLGLDTDKQRFSDIKEGVVTLPLIYFLRRCSAKERKDAVRMIKERPLRGRNMNRIISLVVRAGAMEYCAGAAKKLLYGAERLARELYDKDALKKDPEILRWIRRKIEDV